MAEYIWAAGCRISKKTADPQVVGDSLDSLQRDNGGRLTARVVVDAARPIESPLHSCFEWDDVRAAELYREDQARHVLSSIRILQPKNDPREPQRIIHAYVNVEEKVGDERQRAYVPVARVLSDDDLLKEAINRAAAELRAMEDRYAEFDGIARAVAAAREALEKRTVAA